MGDLTIIEEQQLTKNLTSDQKTLFASQLSAVRKDRNLALLLSVFLGTWGVDRFYAGDIGMGLLKFFTVGGCLILWIIDWFLIRSRVDDHNRDKAIEITQVLLADHSRDRDFPPDDKKRERELPRDERRDDLQDRINRDDRNRDDYR